MNIKDIVKTQLAKDGFDGLFNASGCCCPISNLFPCDCPNGDCEAGYDNKCPMNEDCDCGGFHIARNKHKEERK